MSKLKVNKNKKDEIKKISVSLPDDKPIVINDTSNKGPGYVLLTNVMYDNKKGKGYITGIDLKDKEEYKRSISSLYGNEKIEFMSVKDQKILAKELGKFSGSILTSKKIDNLDAIDIQNSISYDFTEGIGKNGGNENTLSINDAYAKAFNKEKEKKQSYEDKEEKFANFDAELGEIFEDEEDQDYDDEFDY